jgi:hypothetical protein
MDIRIGGVTGRLTPERNMLVMLEKAPSAGTASPFGQPEYANLH